METLAAGEQAQPPTWSPAAALLASCAPVLLVYLALVNTSFPKDEVSTKTGQVHYTQHGSGTVDRAASRYPLLTGGRHSAAGVLDVFDMPVEVGVIADETFPKSMLP